MDDTIVKQKEKLWSDREGKKLAEDIEFLLRRFMNICNMLFEGKFIVQCKSKVFKIINQLSSLVVYDNGCQVRRLCGYG